MKHLIASTILGIIQIPLAILALVIVLIRFGFKILPYIIVGFALFVLAVYGTSSIDESDPINGLVPYAWSIIIMLALFGSIAIAHDILNDYGHENNPISYICDKYINGIEFITDTMLHWIFTPYWWICAKLKEYEK